VSPSFWAGAATVGSLEREQCLEIPALARDGQIALTKGKRIFQLPDTKSCEQQRLGPRQRFLSRKSDVLSGRDFALCLETPRYSRSPWGGSSILAAYVFHSDSRVESCADGIKPERSAFIIFFVLPTLSRYCKTVIRGLEMPETSVQNTRFRRFSRSESPLTEDLLNQFSVEGGSHPTLEAGALILAGLEMSSRPRRPLDALRGRNRT
jgi:hypothetical protein